MSHLTIFVGAICVLLTAAARADTPLLLAIEPPCAQIGTTQQITLRGFRLDDAAEVICHEPGVRVTLSGTAEPWPQDKTKWQLRATLDVPATMPPGNIHLRVRTRSGISNPRSLHLNRLPILAEADAEKPRDRSHPQPIPLETTLWGHLPKYETDWYSLTLAKGQRVSLELLGLRISPTYIDATLRLFSPDGKLLREADTSPLAYHDPATSFVADQAGAYLLSIHDTRNGIDQNDSRYGMGSDCLYVLHVGDFPQPTALFPLGGRCGSTVVGTLTGDPLGPFTQSFNVPAKPTFRTGPLGALHNAWRFRATEPLYPVRDDAHGKQVVGASPLFFMASRHESLAEADEHATAETAQHLPPRPVAVEGRIAKPGETDWYRVHGEPDREYTVEVYARRLRSRLDPILKAFPAGLDGLAVENDDGTSYEVDPMIKVRIKPEGCLVAVADSREYGEADFGYRLTVQETAPSAVLTTAPIETQTLLPLFKTGQQVVVPQGNRMVVLLRTLTQDGFAAPLKIGSRPGSPRLPKGVTTEVPHIPSPATFYPVVVTAAPDAPLAATFIEPIGTTADGQTIEFHQEIGMVYGHPAQTAWCLQVFRGLAIATVEPLPFALDLTCESARAVAGAKTNVLLKVRRDAGWTKPVTIMFPCLPPECTLSMVTMAHDQAEAIATLEISATCPPGHWPIVAVATDSDLPHLRNHHWPYYSNNNGAKETHGLNWVSSGIAYLDVEAKP